MKLRILGPWLASFLLVGIVAIAPPVHFGVVINEVAWSGTSQDATAEWIELVNITDETVDLDGWRLISSDGSPAILLHGTLPPRDKEIPGSGYYLLERGSDDAVPGIEADQIYVGALTDRGETLLLIDPLETIIDTANLSLDEAATREGWAAGTGPYGHPAFCSMERRDPNAPDTTDNWINGQNAYGGELIFVDGAQEQVEDPSFGTPKRENALYNVLPTASLSIAPARPKPGEPAFLDAGGSTDPNNEIVHFVWTFGDGAGSSGQTASHTFEESGTYTISLIVTDEKGGRSETVEQVLVSASTPPIADFSVFSSSSRPPTALITLDPLVFQDESCDAEGEIVSWVWDFGDGATSEDSRPEHAYAKAGTYDVTLVVRDEHSEEDSRTQQIRIANQPPTARFSVMPETPNQNAPVTLDASESFDPDGRVLEYYWDLDDDGIVDLVTTDPQATHTFSGGGEVHIVLAVVDDNGERSLPIALDMVINHAPVAQFQVSDFTPTELAEVAFTDLAHDADGSITAWKWDFGDGSTSSSPSPVHAYSATGTYTVALTVTDDGGITAGTTAQLTVSNLPPVAVLTAASTEADTGVSIPFSASDSRDPSPTGSILAYRWDFDGDGTFDMETSTGSASHTFAENGSYDVTVQVEDNLGAVATSSPVRVIVRNRPPILRRVTWTPALPDDSTDVIFVMDASDADGSITAWNWDFGDGATSRIESPTHAFPADGTFTVRVTVTDNDGAVSETVSAEIEVANTPPIAIFTSTSLGGGTIAFDATESLDPSPDGRIIHIAWDFGDDTTCPSGTADCNPDERLMPSHTYSESGTYTVILVLIDDQGAIARATQTLTIP